VKNCPDVNGSLVNWVLGQNGTDKMVWTTWYTDKMAWTKWYEQNGMDTNCTDKIINQSISLPLMI